MMILLVLAPYLNGTPYAADRTMDGLLVKIRGEADPADRIELLEQAVKDLATKGETLASIYFEIGLAYKELRDFFRAIENFNYSMSYSSNTIPSMLEKTHCLILLDQLDEASKVLEVVLATATGIARPYVLKGMIYEKEGFLSKAEDEFTRALNFEPNSVTALEMRAKVLVKEGKPLKAFQDISDLIRLSPDSQEAFLTRARIRVKLKQYREALEDYRQAEALNPGDDSVAREKVLVFLQTDSPQKALETLCALPTGQPGNAESTVLKARAYILLKNYTEAERILKQAILQNASYGPAYLYYGVVLVRTAKLDEALDKLNRAIELEPTLVEAYKERARIFMNLKEWVRAAADLSSAANLDPGDGETLALRGLTSMERMLYDSAVADFTKALEALPGDPNVLYDRAVAYTHGDQTEAALADLEVVLRAKPDSARTFCMRAIIRFNAGKIAEARQDFQRAAELDPNDPLVWNNSGFFFYKQDDHKTALECFNRALQLNPAYKGAQYNLRVLLQKGDAPVIPVEVQDTGQAPGSVAGQPRTERR